MRFVVISCPALPCPLPRGVSPTCNFSVPSSLLCFILQPHLSFLSDVLGLPLIVTYQLPPPWSCALPLCATSAPTLVCTRPVSRDSAMSASWPHFRLLSLCVASQTCSFVASHALQLRLPSLPPNVVMHYEMGLAFSSDQISFKDDKEYESQRSDDSNRVDNSPISLSLSRTGDETLRRLKYLIPLESTG
eukprot:766764-Hanusia_phi.AAC.3